jgi:SAM-dependent methyltransferase
MMPSRSNEGLRRRTLGWIARGRSTLRACQNADLERLSLPGRVLELGSTIQRATVFRCDGTLVRSNLTLDTEPDVCFNALEGFPLRSSTFDAVLMLNVLEHLTDGRSTLREIHRILRPGGVLILAVPFLYHVHAAPDDFHRFTASALRQLCLDSGFKTVQIDEHGTGSFLAGFSQADTTRAPGWLRAAVAGCAMTADELWRRVAAARKRPNTRGPRHYPLGYMVWAEA